MSDDQLSWLQILKQSAETPKAASEDASRCHVPEESGVEVVPNSSSVKNKKPASTRTRSKRSKENESAAGEPLFSKKDWSKLEFSKSPKSAETPKSEAPKPGTSETVETTPALVNHEVKENLKADPEELSSESQVITVSELNKYIREILEGRFPLVWLQGEISNFKAHTSGHFYFSLKDAKAQINAVMFRGFNSQLRFRPEDGMEVLIRGKITVYEPRGNYQIFCEVMEPVGAGALQKAFEQLKAKLQKEGLFDQGRKRPIPALPRHIAIVTSPTGAAIRDMLNVLGRRFKGVKITVIPCKVQGDQAPKEIVNAIALANRLTDVDVMIVGRGGGSIEDLWAFNDEGVARAIAGAKVPVLSAVGHEVDFTIADFVADLRAPTPSAAAELVIQNAADLIERVAAQKRALKFSIRRVLNSARQVVSSASKRLVDPHRRIQDASIRCDELFQRLDGSMLRKLHDSHRRISQFDPRLRTAVRNILHHNREALGKNAAVLDSLSPLKVLDRGYSMVTVGKDIITDAKDLKTGQLVTIRMCKGSIEAEVKKIEEKR